MTDLIPMGDEALEARIIAWVLGEASSFEAAELESLCEQYPEWRVFQRRMLAMHELLRGASAVSEEEKWTLPQEKRHKLDAILGVADTAIAMGSTAKALRPWWMRMAPLAALLFLLLAIASLSTGVWPQRMSPELTVVHSERKISDYGAQSRMAATATTGRENHDESTDETSLSLATAAESQGERQPMTKDSLIREGKEQRFSYVDGISASGVLFEKNPHDLAVNRSSRGRGEATTSPNRAILLEDIDRAWELSDPMPQAAAKPTSDVESGSASGGSMANAELDQAGQTALSGTLAGGALAETAVDQKQAWLGFSGGKNAPNDQLADTPIRSNPARNDHSLLNSQKLLEENQQEIDAVGQVDELKKREETLFSLAEISAEQEPYSTFSLRVSDNAFRIAQAAMAQGQRPAAESVRVEEFYNAFDYGDPVPTAQEPVAASIEQSAHPILPLRNLLRIGLRTAASGRGAGQPLHLTLLIDQSGSMSRGDRSGALLTAVRELSSLLQPQDHISVVGFSRTPRLLAEKIPGDQPQPLLDLLARTPSDGGTNLEEALKLGEIVAKRNELAGAQNRLLLLTDGAANLGNADPGRLAAWVKALRQKNIAFDIAGIGTDGLNDPLLVEIARHGNGRYYVINNAEQAKQQFATQLAGAFRPAAENVKVQVQFNPKRVGKYQLVGFEKDRLHTEDFRNDKVDAAEMAAAEAGQALYQVELLPDGVGDVGEVSVRFRDVATQQMIERKWTIRYDATVPAFERTAPAMQLAGMAMLTAQKLQGGPASSMIRFSEISQAQQRIRDEFSANPRVIELLEMIRQLND